MPSDTIVNIIEGPQTFEQLVSLLVREGHCDAKSVERCRRVADESGQRLDIVLSQLGLVTERDLATAYASLLGLPIVAPARYPVEPLWSERLSLAFLRHARALPLAEEDGALVLAVADPLDSFTAEAVTAAVGLGVRLEVAVPIELEAAFERLYPADGTASDGVAETRLGAARGGCRAAARSGERRPGDPAGQPINRPRRGNAGQRHPYRTVRRAAAAALSVRWRVAGTRQPAGASDRGDHLPHQDHGRIWTSPNAACRRMAA